MFVTLEVKTGNLAGRRKDIAPGQSIIVGRSERANLVLADDGYASGMHLLIECREDGCHIRDLSSTNGTWVNRQRISEVDLTDGDVVIAGHTVLRIWVRETEAPSAEKPRQVAMRTVHFGPQNRPLPTEADPKTSIRERFCREDLRRLLDAEDTQDASQETMMPLFSPTPPPIPASDP